MVLSRITFYLLLDGCRSSKRGCLFNSWKLQTYCKTPKSKSINLQYSWKGLQASLFVAHLTTLPKPSHRKLAALRPKCYHNLIPVPYRSQGSLCEKMRCNSCIIINLEGSEVPKRGLSSEWYFIGYLLFGYFGPLGQQEPTNGSRNPEPACHQQSRPHVTMVEELKTLLK